ncbi:acetaldehyde dehydrogenase (acetylating) [Clostridium magnum]|uniref:Acetaldehyde dehydrogenase n=1 Tax=Clostridium magnum DSM 2767 TaxID=1121326 RepID=A0A161X299_9CLOT|nr:acetaldehyde dehydrogenase (acetylating) [Clostridium magnum]KZL93618.1 acetaldehyde dehydrogenase [Clostridium magnum DSM 2767]SHI57586.1 acetaldehyde dehydrogenase [Clostridium magnum DSM 2767]
MSEKIRAAIIGPGNIGMDLMYKLMRSKYIQLDTITGIVAESEGLKLAAKEGYNTSSKGIEAILGNKSIDIVFDATGAKPHQMHAPLLKKDGKIAIDLTPAAVGPYVVPAVNLEKNLESDNINMVTCGGQATIPIVAAINEVANVKYAEIVATLASKSAGPGTRQNIDEFTETTSSALIKVGGADKSKAIIILNPAEPSLMMRNTIYTQVENPDENAIREAVEKMVKKVQEYVPGYTLKLPPIIDGDKVTAMVEIEGAGDYLPKYAGNLDIITSAAVKAADKIAQRLLNERAGR